MIGAHNSQSHGPMEFEDFFNLKSDRATQKGAIEKVVPFCSCSKVAYELEKILEFDTTM